MKGIRERRKEELNKHFIYQRSSSIGAVIVSVFVLLDFHIVYSKNEKNGLIYSFNYLFYVQHLKQRQQHHKDNRTYQIYSPILVFNHRSNAAPTRDTNNKERSFIFHISGQ